MSILSFGTFAPKFPTQGIILERITGNLYSGKAIYCMLDFFPHSIGESVEAWESSAEEEDFIIEISDFKIKEYAKAYLGVAIKRKSGWIIKGIAPKMRLELLKNGV